MWAILYLFFKHTNQIEQIVNDVNYKKRQRINELHGERIKLWDKLLEPPSSPFRVETFSRIILRDTINKIDLEIAQLEREIAENRYNQSKGESKMDNREELKRSLAEEEQRAKDSLANVEKMKKQLEELNKKEEQPTVSATGIVFKKLNNFAKYFTIYGSNKIVSRAFSNASDDDIKILENNNLFITEKQAEQEALRRKIQELIRRRAMEWNSNHDWRKDNKERYEIAYNFDKNKIDVSSLNDYCSYGNIVFDTKELAQQMIDELNKNFNTDELKIGFGVI